MASLNPIQFISDSTSFITNFPLSRNLNFCSPEEKSLLQRIDRCFRLQLNFDTLDINVIRQACFDAGFNACKSKAAWVLQNNKQDFSKLTDCAKKTLLMHAISLKDEETTKMLVEYQIALNSVDDQGNNAIHHAAMAGASHHFKYLRNENASAPNNLGQMPVHVIFDSGQIGMLEEFHKVFYGDVPNVKVIHQIVDRGVQWEFMGNFLKAENCYNLAREIGRKYSGDPSDIARVLEHLGTLHHSLGNYNQAKEFNEAALNIFRMHYRSPNLKIAGSLDNLGGIYRSFGKYNEAEKYFEEAKGHFEQLFQNVPHPDLALNLNNLGSISLDLGYLARSQGNLAKWQENRYKALGYFESAYTILKQCYGEHPHRDIALTFDNLGIIYFSFTDYVKAKQYFESSQSILEKWYAKCPHRDIANNLNHLGRVWHLLGDYSKAEAFYRASLDMQIALLGERPHTDFVIAYRSLASLYQDYGNKPLAVSYLKSSLSILEKCFGEEAAHPDTAQIWVDLASL